MSKKDLNPWLFAQGGREFHYVDDQGASSRILFKEDHLPGASLFFAQSQQNQAVRMKEKLEKPVLAMYFSLEGDTGSLPENDGSYMIKGQQHILSYMPAFEGYYLLNSPRISNFGVILEESFFSRLYMEDMDCLKRFWDKVSAGKSADIASMPMNITGRQLALIRDIAGCSYSGNMRQLFLESKIVELFLFQAEQAESLKGISPARLSPADTDRLHAARAFVRQHMLEPFTLHQVARESGLNEFKLKKGFKELFGTTVFGYLNELKMNYARQLLLNNNYNVLETAYTIGYAEPYSFTRAFRKHFGYPPSHLII
ncbi:helix-turn-helix transcriptional regulator [Chitinophaga sp. Mgbs1]|uniref:Helix-turn-helix transcriptional regulator n=1 Tax=Chitinophaga solisilvae TaxID=1233460 RepID=A0A3S1D2C8_9BACT|nr:helix-turn-helix transcriptional regulator [Chitinophaga solisilvae]